MFLIGRGSFPIQSREMLTKDEIQKIADEVVKELGSDFEEKVYQEAFLAELRIRAYEYDRERTIPVLYKRVSRSVSSKPMSSPGRTLKRSSLSSK